MVLINGISCNDDELNPAKHKFIGMFRKPFSRIPRDEMFCKCGANVESIIHGSGLLRDYWLMGHFDIPQYIDIENHKI